MQNAKGKMQNENTEPHIRRLSFCIFPFAFCVVASPGCNLFGARPEPPDAKAPPVPNGGTRHANVR